MQRRTQSQIAIVLMIEVSTRSAHGLPTGRLCPNGELACEREGNSEPQSKKPSLLSQTGPSVNSLTMSYFHTGTRTIIGAEAFHCPVRDGKEWDHLAMVIRLDLSPPSIHSAANS